MRTNILNTSNDEVRKNEGKGKKVLFATVPADGHFNPLTSLAVHLKGIGYEVRWYTSGSYAEKINKLKILHYPFAKALDIRGDNIDELLPERASHKGMVAKLNFDIINFFIKRSTEYFEDIQDIYQDFPFDLMVADCTFTAIPFVKEKLKVPVISIGVVPLTETSKDLPPAGLAMTPSTSIGGRLKQSALRWIADHVLFARSIKVLKALTRDNGLSYEGQNIFDYLVKKSTLFLQSGTPGFEYFRSDLGENIRFIGPVLPHSSSKRRTPWFDERLNQFEKVVLVTQGTVEKDIEKLLAPTLEAFKESDMLVVATTGGSGTALLKERFPQKNFIIEDFIPFTDVMPYADVYVSNGGYGGVLLAIEHELPCVVAGVHEGKSEINARVGFFKLGIDLKTETPQVVQIQKSVDEVIQNPIYRQNVTTLASEFLQYNPEELLAKHVHEILEAPSYKQLRETIY